MRVIFGFHLKVRLGNPWFGVVLKERPNKSHMFYQRQPLKSQFGGVPEGSKWRFGHSDCP